MIDREQVIENYFQCWINENSLILKKLLIQMQSIVNVMDPNTMDWKPSKDGLTIGISEERF